MFSVSLYRADHVRQYSIRSRSGSGWEVRLEEDRALTRHAWYHDWHRVERRLEMFRREVDELTAQGWEARVTGT